MVRTKEQILDLVKQYVDFVDKSIYVEEAYLFGSCAKGFHSEWSDIDVAILSDDFEFIPKPVGMKILTRMAQHFESMIEPVVLRPSEKENPIIGSLAHEIFKTGILILKR
ncbi:MAG: nucleotidyltransferase domain-containing protein [Oligoflexia bacterium]|nr:nucleotidyltransferase domain-containing protein [Oligoflexia bacterium]